MTSLSAAPWALRPGAVSSRLERMFVIPTLDWTTSMLVTLDFLKWSIKLFLWGFVMMLVVLLTVVVLIRDLREISDQHYLSTSTISTLSNQNYLQYII